MSLTFSLLKPPLPSSKLTTTFLHGSRSLPTTFSTLSLSSTAPPPSSSTSAAPLTVKAMRSMQGKVVCATSDKTVNVEVTRLAPHPKYKRRVRKKKKFQAHDPDNIFKVGDWVQLEKCRPISKTKTFLAVRPAARKSVSDATAGDGELGLPLQSEQKDEDKAVTQMS